MPIVVKRPPLLPIIIENEVRLGSDPSASDLWLEIQAEHLRPPECIASLASSICCATDQCHRIVAVLLKQPDHVLAHNLIRLRGDIHHPHFRPAGDGIHHLRERNRRTPPMLNRHPGRRASIEKTLRRTIAQIAGVFPIEGSRCYLTTSTEQGLCCTTRVDTLPRRNRAMAPSPWAPITIRSAWCLEATFIITSAGFPS